MTESAIPPVPSIEVQNMHLKQAFMDRFNDSFAQMVNFISKLNIHSRFKDNAFMNLDQGAFWVRTAISMMEFVVEPPKKEEPTDDKNCDQECHQNCQESVITDNA